MTGVAQTPVASRPAAWERLRAASAAFARDPSLRQAVVIVLALRVSLGLVAWAGMKLEPPGGVNGDWRELLIPESSRSWPFVGPWQRWDALWYEHLAASGYRNGTNDAHFFPLYPAVVHVAGVILGGAFALAGLLVSTIAFAAAIVLLHRMVSRDLGARLAERTVLYTAIAPTAFFFFAAYTESLYLLTTVAAIFAARSRRFVLAGVAGILATLCRPPGVFVVAPLLFEAAGDALARRRRGEWPLRWSHVMVLAPVVALAGFDLYIRAFLNVHGGLSEVEKPWGNVAVGPWTAIADSYHALGQHPEEWINLLAVITLITCLPLMCFRMPWTYVVWAVASTIPIVSHETLISPLGGGARFVVVVFPLLVLLARAGERPWVDRAVLLISLPLMSLLLVHFTHFGFVD